MYLECNTGWEGTGETCTDINECSTGKHDCHINATCTDNDGNFSCACVTGFSGDGVNCSDVDECTDGSHSCDTNANCTNNVGNYTCECNIGGEGSGKTCTSKSVSFKMIIKKFIFGNIMSFVIKYA